MKIDNTFIGFLLRKFFNFIDFKVLYHYHNHNLDFIKKLMAEEDFRFFPNEMFLIKTLAARQNNLEGDYAEVGVYDGCSARMICEMKKDKPFFLFDTFEGLPKVDGIDRLYKKNMFNANYKKVKQKLSKYENVFIYKGLFPQETSKFIKGRKFSFVHLDLDIYKSTKDCLEFFYDKMVKGGIILTHDYVVDGVKKAFDEFLKDKPEKIIELPTQAMIIF